MVAFICGIVFGAGVVFIYHGFIIAEKNKLIAEANDKIDQAKGVIKTDLSHITSKL